MITSFCDNAIFIFLEHTVCCPLCCRLAFFVVNRHGRTRCADCDMRNR